MSLIFRFAAFQYATGLFFWFLDCTDFLTIRRGWCRELSDSVRPRGSNSGTKATSSLSLSYTTMLPSKHAAINRFSVPGIHFIAETGALLMTPCAHAVSLFV